MRVGERDADGTREESRGEEVAPAWKCSVRTRLCGLVRAEHRQQSGGNVHCGVGMQISKTDSRPWYTRARDFFAIFLYCTHPLYRSLDPLRETRKTPSYSRNQFWRSYFAIYCSASLDIHSEIRPADLVEKWNNGSNLITRIVRVILWNRSFLH